MTWPARRRFGPSECRRMRVKPPQLRCRTQWNLSGIQARKTAGAPCGCTGHFRGLHFRRGGVCLWRPLQAVQSVCQRPKCSLLGGAAVKRWRGQANGAGGNGHQGWRKGSISSKWPPWRKILLQCLCSMEYPMPMPGHSTTSQIKSTRPGQAAVGTPMASIIGDGL